MADKKHEDPPSRFPLKAEGVLTTRPHPAANPPSKEELDQLQELADRAKVQRDLVTARFFRVQYSFFMQDIYSHPITGYNPLKHKRLIAATKGLLNALTEWQKIEAEQLTLHSGKPRYAFPGNETTPQQIAATFEQTEVASKEEDTRGSGDTSD